MRPFTDGKGAYLTERPLLERLLEHQTLSTAPRAQIEWVANRGRLEVFPRGRLLMATGQPIEKLYVVLRGRMAIYMDSGGGRKKVMEWTAGDVSGLLPYSRLEAPPGDVIVEEEMECVTLDRSDMRKMTRECYELTAIFVHIMLDRARAFTSSHLHDEKLLSLGKLAAGLAHELNNPAAALTRSAKVLVSCVEMSQTAAHALGAEGLTTEQTAVIEAVRRLSIESRVLHVRSPLEQDDRERDIERWLARRGADVEAAEPLAATDLTIEALDRLAATVDGKALDLALRWIAADSSAHRLTAEIQEAAARVYSLVNAVKGFTQMDRAGAPDVVDVAQGLTNTVMVLRSKARARSASLSVQTEPGLPPVKALAGELNQIWANLTDNALDAVGQEGRVELTAAREGNYVVVRVTDNGSGIPADVLSRIFDPFFTTKPVGSGTGLGLDIVRRLVRQNNGEIDVDSRPGRTEFCVRFPIAGADQGDNEP